MKNQDDLATVLNEYMARADITPDRLSRLSDVPKPTIVNWQTGNTRRPQHWRGLVKIADALELSARDADRLLTAAGQVPTAALFKAALIKKDRELLRRWEITRYPVEIVEPAEVEAAADLQPPKHHLKTALAFGYPLTYRAEEVATIMQWAAAGESGVVVGVSGSGKSNLLSFLSSQTEKTSSHTPGDSKRYCFLHLDINSLPALTLHFFYRELIQMLQDASEQFGAEIREEVNRLTHSTPSAELALGLLKGQAHSQVNWDDIFQVKTIVRKMHQIIIEGTGKKIIWLLDRFDEACRHLDTQTLNSLRSLRDQFKGQLCYVVATRHPLTRLRDPREIGEFYEIVAANTCWVGPMVERDARWIAHQMGERLGTSFNEPEVKQLIEVSGRWPAFMKRACISLAEGVISKGETSQTWAEKLLPRPEFKRNCQEIWDDLIPEEQNALITLNATRNERVLKPDTIAYLEQTGLLVRTAPGGKVRVFSPIFERFLTQLSKTSEFC